MLEISFLYANLLCNLAGFQWGMSAVYLRRAVSQGNLLQNMTFLTFDYCWINSHLLYAFAPPNKQSFWLKVLNSVIHTQLNTSILKTTTCGSIWWGLNSASNLLLKLSPLRQGRKRVTWLRGGVIIGNSHEEFILWYHYYFLLQQSKKGGWLRINSTGLVTEYLYGTIYLTKDL